MYLTYNQFQFDSTHLYKFTQCITLDMVYTLLIAFIVDLWNAK